MQRESKRMWATAAFVGVLIVIGLPLWWKTTEVYRVALPYSKINAFNPESHYVTTELVVLANDAKTAADVAEQIEKEFEQFDVIKFKITRQVLPATLSNTIGSAPDEELAVRQVCMNFDLHKYNTFYVVQRTPLYESVWVGRERIAFFRDAKAGPKLAEALKEWVYQPSVLAGARSEAADASRRYRFKSAPAFHVVMSVVNPTPHLLTVDFDAREALEDYIGSFAEEISDIYNFTLRSQWIHLLDFDFQAEEREGEWWVPTERLPLLLSRLETRAPAHAADGPTINLALYVAPCTISPLIIHNEPRVQALISPKWGGVVFGSPSKEDCKQKTYKPDLHLFMGTFILQLRKLLGFTDKEPMDDAHLECLRSVSPRAWELDALLRIRTLEQVTSAERSLKSLAKLLGEISNIVINDEVGASVWRAVLGLERSTQLVRGARLLAAHAAAKEAFLAAETAFADPSLLALLYFPDDQKYAIYIPLFLPIMLPVVLSLKKLVLWLRGNPGNYEVNKEKTD